METVRVFLVVFCLVAFNRFGVSGSGVVSDFSSLRGTKQSQSEVATSRNASRWIGTGSRNDGDKKTGRGAGAVVEAARKEIGVREASENAGERVDQYCAYVGVKKVAWCAAFVSWCFGQAGYTQPKTAWSPALFPDARSGQVPQGRLRREPLPGMIMGIYFPSMGRIAHCGIVELVRGDFIVSIEGNTNSGGCRVATHPRNDDREGDGVYRRMRHRRSVAKFAEWL